ncbi:MAG: carboxypeptidase-like regulatory domain-containing protein [Sphingomonadaceae bacterium]|nr:carboxypeptidase-like regulatory domain-containing protein [Sphingomonadaceae bacterium]
MNPRRFVKRLTIALLVAAAATIPVPHSAGSTARAATTSSGPEANLLLVELMLEKQQLSDVINVYEVRNDFLLPIDELARLLTIGVTVDPETRIAAGFVATESQPFRLDPGTRTINLRGRTVKFEDWQAQWIDGDLYVARSVLQAVWPVDFAIDLSSLRLTATPREKLPVQSKMERERKGGKLLRSEVNQRGPDLPYLPPDYDIISLPFIDNTVATELRKLGDNLAFNATYSGYLTGDLIGMEASGFFSISKADGNPQGRITLARHDPDGGLLGPLGARSVEFGDVSLPAVSRVLGGGGGGNGYLISNRPFDLGSSYGVQTLRGSLPPGWDVSLYVNDALVAFQTSRPDGQYEFKDLDLYFGRTEFRLVFNGPLGQSRVERRSFLLDQSLVTPGQLFYTIAGKRESDGTLRQVGQIDLGVMRNVAATGSFVLLDPTDGSAARKYLTGGLRVSSGGALFNADYTRDLNGGDIIELGVRTYLLGMSLVASRVWINDFSSELVAIGSDGIKAQDTFGLNGSITLGDTLVLPFDLAVRRDVRRSGVETYNVQQRLSANVWQTNLTNTVNWFRQGSVDTVDGVLQASRRVAGIGLGGQLAYRLVPSARLTNMAVNLDKTLGNTNRLNLGLIHDFASTSTTIVGGISHRFGNFALGFSAMYANRRTFGVGLTLFTAFGRDPTSGRILRDWQPMAGSGLVSANVFIDENGNSRRDPGEAPVPGASLLVNGNSRSDVVTDAAGVALLKRFGARAYANVGINPASLEDVQWQPALEGYRILPHPGKPVRLDLPVILTSEIDGTVRLEERGLQRGIGNAQVELIDDTGVTIATTRTASDGFYTMSGIRPGRYILRIAPDQLTRLGLSVDRDASIAAKPDGGFINGIDFVVRRIN